MTRRISDENKRKRKYGQGRGASYIPWISTEEFNSNGTCSNPIDWKNGRTVHLLSQIEKYVWYQLRWDDDVVEIREQFPLDIEITQQIADKFNINHPKYKGKDVVMTTDFLVTLKSGAEIAINVKHNEEDWNDLRVKEKMYIEKYYWTHYKNTVFKRLAAKDINEILSLNIELVTTYYDINRVHDKASYIKYLIATKQLKVDLEKNILNFRNLIRDYGGSLWNN